METCWSFCGRLFARFAALKILRPINACIVFGAFVMTALSGCYRSFYRTNTGSSLDSSTISRLKSQSKYFILHTGNSANGLQGVYVKNDTLRGMIVPLPAGHAKYLHPDSASVRNRVKAADKTGVFVEVHLYQNASPAPNDSAFSASLSSFSRVDVYELNKSATTTNFVLSTMAIVVPVVLIVGGITCTDCGPYGH